MFYVVGIDTCGCPDRLVGPFETKQAAESHAELLFEEIGTEWIQDQFTVHEPVDPNA